MYTHYGICGGALVVASALLVAATGPTDTADETPTGPTASYTWEVDDDIGPATVPELPDLPDGGGLIPDFPFE
ncbi:hypothetical protein [Streptomyces sp. 4F14]|uniref:hypothetical protein n=1 Tax=Streptomyces sp. 4F14 TaxID=3394380 RepID=UPI003A84D478